MTVRLVTAAPRALAALALTWALVVCAVPLAPTNAGAAVQSGAPTGAELREQRAQLLREIAELTDAVARRQAELVGAQQRRGAADAEVHAARRILQEHAVESFIHAHELSGARRIRNGIYADAIAEADRAVIVGFDRARQAAANEERAAETALAEARAAEEELSATRERLERTIATVEAHEAEARRNAEARRLALLARPAPPMPPGATHRHRDATARQAELMATWPFGPLPAGELPAGLVRTGAVVEGMASWYGPGFDGRATASGAIYDQEGWTVASKELPLGTMLLVTRNDRSALVLVNDRGPYVAGRVLDLSHGVAVVLDTVGPGVAWVRAEVVIPGPNT